MAMSTLNALGKYLTELCAHLGHVNRHENFCDYLKGLLLVEGRKSVESMAAMLYPLNTRARHQALHHLWQIPRGQIEIYWIKLGNG